MSILHVRIKKKFKRILKWVGIVISILIVLLLITAIVIYVAFPTTEIEVVQQVEGSHDDMFAAFINFDHWHEYWDINELIPPDGKLGVGATMAYVDSDGRTDLEFTEYEPGKVIRFKMSADGIEDMGDFILRFEPTATGSVATATNRFETNGPLHVVIALYAMTGEINRYYDNMIENVERVALDSR